MTRHDRFGILLRRLASLTSITRTRAEDVRRVEFNGGVDKEMAARIDAAIAKVEKAVAELEGTLI